MKTVAEEDSEAMVSKTEAATNENFGAVKMPPAGKMMAAEMSTTEMSRAKRSH